MNSDLAELYFALERIDKITDREWKASLNDRKRKELEFHDRDRSKTFVKESLAGDTYEKFYGNKKYYKATIRSNKFIQNWISRECRDKVFLDYACGNGGNAIKAATSGALLSLGFDISSVSVSNARMAAEEANLKNVRFFQADAENTGLPDSSIDLIICSGMLHHLDLSYALPELRRILRPGGKVLAGEALDYNPLIKLYRKLTPDMRTEWEKAHILDLRDIDFASRFMSVTDIRYWHIIGYIGGRYPALFPLLDPLDAVLERIPFVQRMAWIFTFELTKNMDD